MTPDASSALRSLAAALVAAAPAFAQRAEPGRPRRRARAAGQPTTRATSTCSTRSAAASRKCRRCASQSRSCSSENEQLKQAQPQPVPRPRRPPRTGSKVARPRVSAAPRPPPRRPQPPAPHAGRRRAAADPRSTAMPARWRQGADERAAYERRVRCAQGRRYADSAQLFQPFLSDYPERQLRAQCAVLARRELLRHPELRAGAGSSSRPCSTAIPTHDKAAGALLKVGLSQYGLKQMDAAEATLAQVIQRYPGTDAARTADDRLRAIQLGRVR